MRQVASTVVYANPWMSVREDTFELPDGTRGTYGVVDKPDFAVVIAEQDGCFHLVEQFRYPTQQRSWEFPMGGWPAGKGGTAAELAAAELVEETGVTAGTWRHLGRLTNSNGFCSQQMDVFHATDLTAGAHRREDTEADMVHRLVPEEEFRQMILDGRINDSETICAYGLFLLHSGARRT
ncbi:NUDIX hydrolase [Nakamurella silvestris]|nr:NUDIX hydrolase [Nakamurella silvestris]